MGVCLSVCLSVFLLCVSLRVPLCVPLWVCLSVSVCAGLFIYFSLLGMISRRGKTKRKTAFVGPLFGHVPVENLTGGR